MLRSSLIVAAAGLLCSTAVAQSQVDSGKILPVTTPVKHAGNVDVVTGKWTPAGATTKAIANLFNNTCFYDAGTGFIYYGTSESCEEFYDEGQVPASNNTLWQSVATGLGGSGSGAANSNAIDLFEFTYCTWEATTDIEVAFWDTLNGDCVGTIAPTGGGQGHWSKTFGTPGGGANAPVGYYDLSGIGLPGSSSPGASLACWIVGISNIGLTLQGDGDGSFDNDPANDKFIWAFRNNDVSTGSTANGWLITGDPNVIPAGSCTYDIPCQTDWTGGVCGSGYGSADLWWINSDGGVAGVCAPGAANSGCYYYGGYPTNLQGGFWLRLEGDVSGTGSTVYCTSRPASIAGCTPTLSASVLQITKGAAGTVPGTATPVPGGNSPGILIFGKTLAPAPIIVNFGELCLQGFNRAPTTITAPGGTVGSCSGTYNFNLQAAINNASAAQAAPGDTIYFQAWYRDGGYAPPANANLTNAMGDFAIL